MLQCKKKHYVKSWNRETVTEVITNCTACNIYVGAAKRKIFFSNCQKCYDWLAAFLTFFSSQKNPQWLLKNICIFSPSFFWPWIYNWKKTVKKKRWAAKNVFADALKCIDWSLVRPKYNDLSSSSMQKTLKEISHSCEKKKTLETFVFKKLHLFIFLLHGWSSLIKKVEFNIRWQTTIFLSVRQGKYSTCPESRMVF